MAARKQYLLRIDPELWGEVEKWAADELRSVNAQVEYLLREAVRRRHRSRTTGNRHSEPGGSDLDAPGDRDPGTGNGR